MSLLRLFERRTIQDPNIPLTAANLINLLGLSENYSPVSVTPESSMQVSAVHACIRLLSDSVAQLPIDLFLRTGEHTRQPVSDNPYARLLTKRPNELQTRSEFWRAVMGSKLLRGNAYIFKTFDRDGNVTGLYPLPANKTRAYKVPYRPGVEGVAPNQLVYVTTVEPWAPDVMPDELFSRGDPVVLSQPWEIMHIRDFTVGLVGLSRLDLARTLIGSSLAAEEYGARFFGNDARPGGFIGVQGTLSDKSFERMNLQWNSLHQGVKQAHKMAIMEGGATWNETQLNPDEAQFLETRKFGVIEIARLYGVPPHLIMDVERSTSWGTGIEQQVLGYLQFTLLPHLIDLEAKIDLELLEVGPNGSEDLFMRFNVDSMKRADLLARAQALHLMRIDGIINGNDWRLLEDMQPIPGEAGNEYWQPANMLDATNPMPQGGPGQQMNQLIANMVEDAVSTLPAARTDNIADLRAPRRVRRIHRDPDGQIERVVEEREIARVLERDEHGEITAILEEEGA